MTKLQRLPTQQSQSLNLKSEELNEALLYPRRLDRL